MLDAIVILQSSISSSAQQFYVHLGTEHLDDVILRIFL